MERKPKKMIETDWVLFKNLEYKEAHKKVEEVVELFKRLDPEGKFSIFLHSVPSKGTSIIVNWYPIVKAITEELRDGDFDNSVFVHTTQKDVHSE